MAIALLAMLCVDGTLISTGIWLATDTINSPTPSESPALPEIREISFPQTALLEKPSNEITSRPLFWSSRRPFEPIVQPAATQTALPPALQTPDQLLLGILITGAYRRALFRRPNEMEGVWLNEGEKIDGWRISKVDTDHAILEANDQIVKLELYPVGKPSLQ